MSRVKSLVTAGLLAGSLMLASIGAASAAPGNNPNHNAGNSGNCIAVFSAQITGNGQFSPNSVSIQAKSGTRAQGVHAALANEGCGN